MPNNGPRRSDAYITAVAQVLVVVLTGIANFVATKQTVDVNRVEIEQARKEIHQIFLNQEPFLKSDSALRMQQEANSTQTKENNQLLLNISKTITPADKLESWGQSTRDNSKRIEDLTKRIEELELEVAESRAAANKAADISLGTQTAVKNTPRRTTVIHRKVQRIQNVRKVYKLF